MFSIRKNLLLASISLSLWMGCNPADTSRRSSQNAEEHSSDVHSCARPEQAANRHLSLDLVVDFQTRTLSGSAAYQITNREASTIWFDTRDLEIDKVTLGEDEVETTFTLGEEKPFLGRPLQVTITPETELVTIYYHTSPQAAALDWLNPQQTAGKRYPFLFTQGQAILTRTWIPIQDSPGIRITYDATITVPTEMLAVMSATNPQEKNEKGVYTFKMEQPIPPYLIALAVGDLAFQSMGARTGVYAEPALLDASAFEFADMEKMLAAAEELYGPYLWDRYDLIVLPPSFPFGGMENPRLTFATPTILAGDRSLTSLVAHELAHSWSGNLVTNATWNDFWLNEGFTVYFERRIMQAIYGESYENMLAVLGYQDLEEDVEALGASSEDTHLFLNLDGRDPDDGMTDIAYEKGAFFLKMLEEKVGKPKFDAFLRDYFNEFRFQSMTTDRFLEFLNQKLILPNKLDVNIEEWVFGPGIPSNCPKVFSERFEKVDAQRISWLQSGEIEELETTAWSTHEWLHFLRKLPVDTNPELLEKLDNRYQLSQSGNAEILAAWFEKAIYAGFLSGIQPELETFLVKIGRRKFLSPLYGALVKTGNAEWAREVFGKARDNYHSVSAGTVASMLEVK